MLSKLLRLILLLGLILSIFPSLADAQDGIGNNLRVVESDDNSVTREGSWTSQNAGSASGGQYLYSSGDPNDALTLRFRGTIIGVMYVSSPQLGMFTIEVDGTSIRTITTTDTSTTFQQSSIIKDLTDDWHSVRVYAIKGTIAIDAFFVDAYPTPAQPTNLDGLLSKVDQYGTLDVIVGLNVPFVVESKLSRSTDVQQQRAAIEQKRDAVINDVTRFGAIVRSTSDQWTIPYVALQVNKQTLQALMSSPDVVSIRESGESQLQLSDSTALVNANPVWNLGYEGQGQTVAVLDTGFLTSHPMLNGKVVAEACFSSSNATRTSLCSTPGAQTQVGLGSADITRCVQQNSGDNCQHGTHVAAIAVGNGPNLDGVARASNLIPITVFRYTTGCVVNPPAGVLNCINVADIDLISALQYIYSIRNQYQIASVNISIGGQLFPNSCDTNFPETKLAIDLLWGAGIPTIIAAGNNRNASQVSYPGCISTAVTIGASNKNDTMWDDPVLNTGSNNHPTMVDLVAPGTGFLPPAGQPYQGIESASFNVSGPPIALNPTTVTMSGTSMAAPHVAGAWAVLKSFVPDADPQEILNALTDLTNVLMPRIQETRQGQNYPKPRLDILVAYNTLSAARNNGLLCNVDPLGPAIVTKSTYGTQMNVQGNGRWSQTFDFTLSNGGWVDRGNGGADEANYTPGIGWQNGTAQSGEMSYIRFNLLNSANFTFAEFTFTTNAQPQPYQSAVIGRDGVDLFRDNSQAQSPGGTLTFIGSPSQLINSTVDLAVNVSAVGNRQITITRATFWGTGINPFGGPQDDWSDFDISGDGRYVVFSSYSSNLVLNDTNNRQDVFLHDRQQCITTLISRRPLDRSVDTINPPLANGDSFNPVISSNGRYIAFESTASNLVLNDTNGSSDIFLYDLQFNQSLPVTQLRLISLSSVGSQVAGNSSSPFISNDGQVIAFSSNAALVPTDTNGVTDVYIRNIQTSTTTRISTSSTGTQSTAPSYVGNISGNGQYVVFNTTASNMVSGDINNVADLFVKNIVSGTTTRVSITNAGGQVSIGTPINDVSISDNGQFIAFPSADPNLVAGDTNGIEDIFVRDTGSNTTMRINVSTSGQQANASYNADSYPLDISADGRYVVFASLATNLVASDSNAVSDIFLRDRNSNITTRVNVLNSLQANNPSYFARISKNGAFVAFASTATNLASPDTNNTVDIFVTQISTATTPAVPTNLNADNTSPVESQVRLTWTDNSYNESYFQVQRSIDNINWQQLGTTFANRTVFIDNAPSCTTYYYRVYAVRVSNPTNPNSGVSNVVTAQPCIDTLALFNTSNNQANLVNTLQNNPAIGSNYTYSHASAPPANTNNRWVMGDWDGDGLDTAGVYATNGTFYYTNQNTSTAVWSAIWIGYLGRPPVVGRFNLFIAHDCIGVVDSWNFAPPNPDLAFALYFTCDLTNGTAPTLTLQWLSVLLPDSGGFSGTFQFGAGDFDGNGIDSVAVRRGTSISFTNTNPTTASATFNKSQFWGTPPTSSGEGQFIVGEWNNLGLDSFGVYYQNGSFVRRTDLGWFSSQYVIQQVNPSWGTTNLSVAGWRPR